MMEYGPYIYREYDTLSLPKEWDVPITLPGQYGQRPHTNNGIYTTLNQMKRLDTEKTTVENQNEMDKKLWQINQGA